MGGAGSTARPGSANAAAGSSSRPGSAGSGPGSRWVTGVRSRSNSSSSCGDAPLYRSLVQVHQVQGYLRQRLERGTTPAGCVCNPPAPALEAASESSSDYSVPSSSEREAGRAAPVPRTHKTFDRVLTPPSISVTGPAPTARKPPLPPADRAGAPGPPRLYSARAGYLRLLDAGPSLPALAALVNHAAFAKDPEAWAPALLALALSELADRGLLAFGPALEDGIADGEVGYSDFGVQLEPAARGRPLPMALAAVAGFVEARAGGRARAMELCRAFLAERDPASPAARGVYSVFTGVVARELTAAGLKRVLPRVGGFRFGGSGRLPAPGGPEADERTPARGSARVDISPSSPLTPAGREAAVAGVTLARALYEAEAEAHATSLLARDMLRELLEAPLYPSEPPRGDALATCLLLAVSASQRPRFWAAREDGGPSGPLPGLGRAGEEPEGGHPLVCLDAPDILSRVLFLAQAKPPWQRRPWVSDWAEALAAEEAPAAAAGPLPDAGAAA